MANRSQIIEEINRMKNEGQDIIRRNYLKKLFDHTGNATIIYFSSFSSKNPGIPASALSISLDDIQGFMNSINGISGRRLDLILHSLGGSLEAADQIVHYLRSKFDYIRAFVPQNAMSAATMIACACDEIILGRESAIGPIDPQITIPMPNNITTTLPAQSILEDFKKAISDISSNPALAGLWAPKLASIPIGILDFCEKTIDNSKAKVGEWLDAYMFKDDAEKKGRAIAQWLGDFNIHKTHGRPINYELALEQGLKVKRLEDDPELQDMVLSVFHATLVTFDATSCIKIIENHMGKGSYTVLQTQIQPQILLPQPPIMPIPPNTPQPQPPIIPFPPNTLQPQPPIIPFPPNTPQPQPPIMPFPPKNP